MANVTQVLSQSTQSASVVPIDNSPISFVERVQEAFQTAFEGFIEFLPQILAALIIIIVGWIIAVILGKLVKKLLDLTRVDKALDRLGLKRVREDTGLRLSVSGFVGGLVKWFLIIVAVLAAADILGLAQISEFLRSILVYFPNIVVSVVIVIIGVLVGNFVHRLVLGAGKAAKLPSIPAIAVFAQWAIIIFSVLAALVQLQVASSLIQILFTGIVAMLAIAGGLAFGLGGRNMASGLLDKLQKKTMNGNGKGSSKGGDDHEPMMSE